MTDGGTAGAGNRKLDRIENGLKPYSGTLELLQAEMQSLAGMMPGVTPSPGAKSDDEIEAAFDNMPV